jgi:hypothetical protein
MKQCRWGDICSLEYGKALSTVPRKMVSTGYAAFAIAASTRSSTLRKDSRFQSNG